MRNPKWTYLIRIVAAAYIVYLGISMIQEIQKGAVTGGMVILGIVAVIAFFGFSVWAVISGVRGMIAESAVPKETPDETDEEAQARADEEEKERIRRLTAPADPEQSRSLFAKMDRFSETTSEEDGSGEE